jgi:RHH-type proline utilization regulon transcriptional repressor/proline dehydrogenase/delta 1-pyrroline-5-carboxylate dehydrogenase
MEGSNYIIKAKEILKSVQGHPLSSEQRREKAIELAGLMLEESRRIQTYKEKQQQRKLACMLNDPIGKTFATNMTDQCFRTNNNARVADQLVYLINRFGIPKFLSPLKKIQLFLFKYIGKPFSFISVSLAKRMLRKETENVILPGEPKSLLKHIKKRRKDGIHINLNHLGEAILGEDEAKHRLTVYLNDLASPDIEYISIKISTIYSQISYLAWEDTLSILEQRLKQLYRAAQSHQYVHSNGKRTPKFVNLDMEEYHDLHLTVALFKRVLDDPEFFQHSAGIVLQAYLPDAFLHQQELTNWAINRVNMGGAPIKIRLVKGANLAMEQVEASLKGWPQAPYLSKTCTDTNYKQMLSYAFTSERAASVHTGVGSHNLFDIAFTMIFRVERGIEKYVSFEMLEGMADHLRRVVQSLTGNMLLYCPAATKHEFQNAVAYLMRRLDENTAPENFLRHAFDMLPGTAEWQNQADLFSRSCQEFNEIENTPRRSQSRLSPPCRPNFHTYFENEPDTDWSLPQNIKWAEMITKKWHKKYFGIIPLVIGGEELSSGLPTESKIDPSYPKNELYRYAIASHLEVEFSLKTAEKALEKWSKLPLNDRLALIDEASHHLRCKRENLIGVMLADTAKTIEEADVEVSEAIDFATFYRRSVEELYSLKEIEWSPKGIILVAPPWNFPCSISAGGILAALAAGNAVIFKPAPESILVGWQLVNILWEAGISKEILQFFCCTDDPVGSSLVQDPRISVVILTGATSTAKKFMKLRPGKDLIAETGGKNAIIITRMADRDLAIKDLLQSAFGHSGQKCSACSLAILEKEVYDDPNFRRQLKDAASSLKVGLPWYLSTKINPLIRKPSPELQRGLVYLDEDEEWLLKPEQSSINPNLWSPGIKLGVKPGSFMHQTELFGPVLAVMRAENLSQAIEWANATPYGLTAGIHTLDEREKAFWLDRIIAGNCYINRTITGAIVRRQPFGGCKDSSFGHGAKAGGPNYLISLMQAKIVKMPAEREPLSANIVRLHQLMNQENFSVDKLELWLACVGSYAFYWNHLFSKSYDPSKIKGQDNFLYYLPRKGLVLRMQKKDCFLDILKVVAASLTCGTSLEISVSSGILNSSQMKCICELSLVAIVEENENQLINRIKNKLVVDVRFISQTSQELQQTIAETACRFLIAPAMACGRIELLHYLREVSLSSNYHRYGYVGT